MLMCDYSLMCIPNRLAREEEDLVSHRFETGAMGLAAGADLRVDADPAPAKPRTFWSAVRDVLLPPPRKLVPAVCVPPGAKLLLMDIPDVLQNEIGVGRVEVVTFTQITAAAHSFRDAVRFRNGREVLLQRLREGQRIRVLALNVETEVVDARRAVTDSDWQLR
jgi:hypothetical protein